MDAKAVLVLVFCGLAFIYLATSYIVETYIDSRERKLYFKEKDKETLKRLLSKSEENR